MFISVTNLKIMVSVTNAENLGIRQVCKKDEAISIMRKHLFCRILEIGISVIKKI